MKPTVSPALRPVLAWVFGLTLLAILGTAGLRGRLPRNVGGDFICFWSAAEILASGGSPYDPAAQARVQQPLGWDPEKDGLGMYDYMPYLYPPWLGLLVVPLLALGYATAKALWLVLDAECLIVSGYFLVRAARSVSWTVGMVAVPVFMFSWIAVVYAQVAPLVLLALAATWWLLEERRDVWAGAVLAWVTVKPQLTILAVAGLLLWAIRVRRWRLLSGLAGGFLVLSLIGVALVPRWPYDMLQAMRHTPLPTDARPWYGTTWLCLLRAAVLHGLPLWVLYLAAAFPFAAAVVLTALRRGNEPDRFEASSSAVRVTLAPAPSWRAGGNPGAVLGIGVLAAFFVAPYSRVYDYPVLLVPFFALLGSRLAPRWASLLLIAVLLGPYVQLVRYPSPSVEWNCTFFWVPVLLAAAWLGSACRTCEPGSKRS